MTADTLDCKMMEHLPFDMADGISARARIGLVVLASDYTVEHEFRRIFTLPGVGLYQARIENSPIITPQTLAAMSQRLTKTVDLILPGDEVDVVAFGCTSASTVLGEDAVAAHIHAARPNARATNPITAAFAAFEALGAKRIAALTPYRRDVNEVVLKCITDRGFEVPVFGSFNEKHDANVARIDGQSLRAGIRQILKDQDVDAVFISCTSIRLLDAIGEIEAEIGLPVISSNHAMAWHCLRLAGIDDKMPELGRLFRL